MTVSPAPTLHQRRGLRVWLPAETPPADVEAWLGGGAQHLQAIVNATGSGRVLGTGRGAARALQLGGRSAVLRQNRHGGLLGGLLGARYLSAVRLSREIALSQHLLEQGIATPRVLLALAEKRAGFWEQYLATEEVVGAQTVFDARGDEAALAAADALLERVFEAGLWATDLHPANMLWQPDPERAEGGVCWIIDLAGAALRTGPLRVPERAARRARFARYFQKHAGEVPERFRVA